MRAILRSIVLGTSVVLLSWSALSGQQTGVEGAGGGAEAEEAGCTTYCAGTAAACTWAALQMGINAEFCAGWLAGCLTGCQM